MLRQPVLHHVHAPDPPLNALHIAETVARGLVPFGPRALRLCHRSLTPTPCPETSTLGTQRSAPAPDSIA